MTINSTNQCTSLGECGGNNIQQQRKPALGIWPMKTRVWTCSEMDRMPVNWSWIKANLLELDIQVYKQNPPLIPQCLPVKQPIRLHIEVIPCFTSPCRNTGYRLISFFPIIPQETTLYRSAARQLHVKNGSTQRVNEEPAHSVHRLYRKTSDLIEKMRQIKTMMDNEYS